MTQVRQWRLRPDGLGLTSNGVPDILWAAVGPPTTVPVSVLTGARMSSTFTTVTPGADTFVLRQTIPVCADPLNPQPTDNAGWNGTSTRTLTGLQTVAAGAVVANTTYNGDVSAGVGASFTNCLFKGQVAVTSRLGFVLPAGDITLNRCTIYGNPGTVEYYRNGIKAGATGTIRTTRCVIVRVVDMLRSSGARLISNGDVLGPSAVFTNDLDHPAKADGSEPWPLLTHQDPAQATVASTLQHEFVGSVIWGFADTTGVTWSGGSPGVGTPSNGPTTVGDPAGAMQLGFKDSLGRCNRSNGLSFTNVGGQKALIDDCWIHGVDAPSGKIQFTVASPANQITMRRNRFYLDGKPSASGVHYLASWPAGTVMTIGAGADANIYANDPVNPAALRGLPLTFTATGAKYQA